MEPMVMAVAALLWVPFGGFQNGLALLCVLPSALLLPRWREPLLRRLETSKLRQLNRVDPGGTTSIEDEELGSGRTSYPWWPLVSELLFVLCRFAGFWCCLQTFGLLAGQPLGLWLAAFALAWTVGLVIPAAPGGLGVFEAVKATPKTVWVTAKYTDKSSFAPDNYLTSLLYDFAGPLTEIVSKIQAGESGGYYPLGFQTGVSLQEPKHVSDDVKKQVDQIIEDLKSGKINVEKNTEPIE
jgi:hypothetical protein